MPNFTRENEDCGVTEGGNSVLASTTTAMTLWQKFANWQNEMEECRSKIRNVRQQQEQCMAQIANLQAIREVESQQIEQLQRMHGTSEASAEEPSLGMLRDLQRQLDEAEKEYRIAAASLQNLQQQRVVQTDQRHETMQQVLNQSRQFRWECQQVQQQLQATVPAQEFLSSVNGFRDNFDASIDISPTAHSLRATLYAILASKSGLSDVGSEDPWITKTLQDLKFSTSESVEIEEVDENDPATWTFIHENDVDFHRVIAEYKRERKALDATAEELQALEGKQEVIQSKAHDRKQRVFQLREQLERLQGDCSRMDSEINRYKQLILDDETLAHTYREKINERNRRQSGKTLNRRIGLPVRDQDPLGVSRSNPRSLPVPSLIPPIAMDWNEASSTPKTSLPFKNPYASSRKHAMETISNCNTPCDGNEPTVRRGRTQEDLAAVVLGRPSQRLKHHEQDASIGDAFLAEPSDSSSRKNRARTFRNSLQFGCTLEVLNYDTVDNDGDAAAGAVSTAAAETRQQRHEVDDSGAILEDEDFLNFVAFPSSTRKTPE